jgi:hypothetical protein
MDGTRFRLFPQPSYLEGFEEPETVTSPRRPAASDRGRRTTRCMPSFRPTSPPPTASRRTPSMTPRCSCRRGPDIPAAGHARPDGHFDHLEPGTAQFEAAHLFGTVHFVVDIWRNYFGRPLRWHFDKDYDRLELSILPELDNAYAGYGFIEVGGHWSNGRYHPFSLNFDVVAHESGI